MSQRQMQGQPMIILGDDAERMKDKDAQSHNISAARAVAESVRSTLGPKGMDKMLVSSLGDVTVTNDGVTILSKMDIDNPTAEMIVEVAEAQEDEAGDGTTTAVAIAGELLGNAEDLLEQDIHPTSIIGGYDLAATRAKEELDDIAIDVDPDDREILTSVAETSMTGKGAELNKELLAALIVDAVEAVSVEADDGTSVADLEFLDIETRSGRPVEESELVRGAILDNDPVHEDMQKEWEDAGVLLLRDPIELDETEVDAKLSVDDPDQLQSFLDQEEEQLREMVDKVLDTGADVIFCQKGIDDIAQHLLAEAGVLAVSRTQKHNMEFLREVIGGELVTDLDQASADDLGRANISWNDRDEHFQVEGTAGQSHGVTIMLRASTEHVVDELERGVEDALEVVAATVSDGRVLGGAGAPEVEVAARLRDYADGIEGREQLAIEAFADALEMVPRTLAENAGLDPIDALVDIRAAHEDGDTTAGLNVHTGEITDSVEAGVVEPAHAKQQAVTSAAEAANLVLKIDDIIDAGDMGDDEGGPGGAPGGMGGGPPGGGMGGGMGGMM